MAQRRFRANGLHRYAVTRYEDYDIVVVRNLHPSTHISEIFYELERYGFKLRSIRNAVNNLTQLAVPLYFIKLEKRPSNYRILRLRRLLGQPITIEQYRPNPEILRCTNCQGLGHLRERCYRPPICAWCSGPHSTRACKKSRDEPPTCSRCAGMHPANYKGCQVYRTMVFYAKRDLYRQSSSESSISPDIFRPVGPSVTGSSSGYNSDESDGFFPELNNRFGTERRNITCPECMMDQLSFAMEHYFSINSLMVFEDMDTFNNIEVE